MDPILNLIKVNAQHEVRRRDAEQARGAGSAPRPPADPAASRSAYLAGLLGRARTIRAARVHIPGG